MRLFFSIHAIDMIAERSLSVEWAVRALASTDVVEADPRHPKRLRALKAIPERDGRVLRVVYEEIGEYRLIFTFFFDRGRRQ